MPAGGVMERTQQEFVQHVLDSAPDLTLATLRPDGYPQATTVSFAHQDMVLYIGIGRHSQKADNIRHNDKVSLTINLPYHDWRDIRGLSMSAHAEILDDPVDAETARACLERRFPSVSEWIGPDMAHEVVFLRIRPVLVSVIDYSKGFGHTELVPA
jgi:nitroimidazol reductase NimA-like FMN-containing flavoprotein (pyridoxamine 5'-phosphate oxidase superfamily)